MTDQSDERVEDGIELENGKNLSIGKINIEEENYEYFNSNQGKENEELSMVSVESSENLDSQTEEMKKMEKIVNEIDESEKDDDYLENIEEGECIQSPNSNKSSESIENSDNDNEENTIISNQSRQSDNIIDQDVSEEDYSQNEEESDDEVEENWIEQEPRNEDTKHKDVKIETVFENGVDNNYAPAEESVCSSTELGKCEEQIEFSNNINDKKNDYNIINVINKKISKRKNSFLSLFKKKPALNPRENSEDDKNYNNQIEYYKANNLYTSENGENNRINGNNLDEKEIDTPKKEKNVSIDSSIGLKSFDSKYNFTALQNSTNNEKDEHAGNIRYCIQTSDNLILDVKEERIGIINLNNRQEDFIKNNKKNSETYNNTSMEDNFTNEGEENKFRVLTTISSASASIKKIYSFDKIKSFVSNNTYLRKKTSTLLKKKSQISKELHFFCYNYNNLLCFIFYILCFGFIISSLYYDSWKRHEIKLKSDNMKKVVTINIGSTTIKRIQKIINSNGDVIYSIDKDQKMDSLLEHPYCKNIEKPELENFLIDLASKNQLKNNEEEIFNSQTKLDDSFLLQALLNIGDVGLLKDEKIILSRKYIFGSTIYNLECKFLGRLKKAGIFHKILLYVILVFLFISISLLLFIIIKYKSINNIQILKYVSFVLVNFALITLISTMFSITREYNIPLCVQVDGSSDICIDGRSIYLIRASIILIIFSNLFFCKFINIINNNVMDDVVV
ncbi:hypothetical protein YYG_01322 [Plasmodium vinckei petteri]|uniref:Uncharacterized protein n=1 Tax=Plasmodium vinckei petteri TaxID=138298 RepID=W7AN24_PLAVN|nr:hypothetical protein YYG_01322 [Plasmodium vinckei petteri]CAD2108508.1 conserved Plasmodium protein, unknown function [Plasmodium vinckei petteri]